MQSFFVDIERAPADLREGLTQLRAARPHRFSADGIAVVFQSGEARRLVMRGDDTGRCTIVYGRPIDAFRAMGWLFGISHQTSILGGTFVEKPLFDTLGVLVDVSRNGVLLPKSVRALLDAMSLMGLDTLLLYTEDTYTVAGQPMFGYLRGAYTAEEIASLDRYAANLGITMIPCIQTLGHLSQVLQWPQYADLQDVDGVLLADASIDAFLKDIIHAASAPYRSKRIHVCMDEAFGLGSGRYRQLHGAVDGFTIFSRHLERVDGICHALGLRPMIWSDMYFRLGSKTNDYYDLKSVVPAAAAASIPPDVQLVYWDYYHLDSHLYEEMIDRHRALGKEPIVAGGIWTWSRFWAQLPYTAAVTDALMAACRKKNVREVIVTIWGDDGQECDVFSALPALQRFAEHGHAVEEGPRVVNVFPWPPNSGSADSRMKENFHGITELDYDDLVVASALDVLLPSPHAPYACPNPSKALLWQDPLLALCDPQYDGLPLRSHYESLAQRLEAAARKSAASRLRFPALIARAISLKCDLRRNLHRAYQAGDHAGLRAIVDGDLAALRVAVDALWKCHRQLWLDTFKPFGLEVLENRYGGLRARLETTHERLTDYLAGHIAEIPELAVTLQRIWPQEAARMPGVDFARCETPSTIK